MPSAELNALATRIMDCAFKVHRTLGPGLFESIYQACLKHELIKNGIEVRCGVAIPVIFDGVELDCGYQVDMLIEDSIIIENKTVETVHPIHHAQLLTYLRVTGKELGYLINWNVPLLKQGIKRLVNNA